VTGDLQLAVRGMGYVGYGVISLGELKKIKTLLLKEIKSLSKKKKIKKSKTFNNRYII